LEEFDRRPDRICRPFLPKSIFIGEMSSSYLLRLLSLSVCALTLPVPGFAQHRDATSAEERLARALCKKQIIVLGELPSHGESRGFQAKARIVKRLVEECGFDAVLFESPIYDFLEFQRAAATGSATPSQLDRAIGRFWLTRELAEWRQWLFQRATKRGLVLAGLDDQVSVTSDYARATLPALAASFVPVEKKAECETAVARNLYWRYDSTQLFDEPERILLERCAQLSAKNAAQASNRGLTTEPILLENLATYFSRQRDASLAPNRDTVMYRNFRWHRTRIPPGSKVIVWTATVHAARRQGVLTQTPLGAHLAAEWRDRVAVVGFTALGGQSSMAGRPSRELVALPSSSLENRTSRQDTAWTLLSSRDLRDLGNVPSRLLGRIVSEDWSGYFDFVLVIREEIAPVFERW
jgi:erythromycin esterase-like protein